MIKQFTIPSTGTGNVYTLEDNVLTWLHHGGGVYVLSNREVEQIDKYLATGWWKEVEMKKANEVPETIAVAPTAQKGAVASDGGSSSYYDISLPKWLIARILERYEDGHAYIKTEELIEVAFDNDFDAGNAFKSAVRLWGSFNGAGKAGNTVSYEKKKIEYSVGKLEQRFGRKEAA